MKYSGSSPLSNCVFGGFSRGKLCLRWKCHCWAVSLAGILAVKSLLTAGEFSEPKPSSRGVNKAHGASHQKGRFSLPWLFRGLFHAFFHGLMAPFNKKISNEVSLCATAAPTKAKEQQEPNTPRAYHHRCKGELRREWITIGWILVPCAIWNLQLRWARRHWVNTW